MKSDHMLNFKHLSNQANALRGLSARHWVIETAVLHPCEAEDAGCLSASPPAL